MLGAAAASEAPHAAGEKSLAVRPVCSQTITVWSAAGTCARWPSSTSTICSRVDPLATPSRAEAGSAQTAASPHTPASRSNSARFLSTPQR